MLPWENRNPEPKISSPFIQTHLDQMLLDWKSLLVYSWDKANFDQKHFRILSDNLARRWARLDINDQGYFCEEIAKFLKE